MQAFSRLDQILRGNNVTVSDLYKLMAAQGVTSNLKSLYRLADPHKPLERLDLRLAGAICETFGVHLGDLISFKAPADLIRSLSRAKQRRLERLMEANSRGTISQEERVELQDLVNDAEEIMLANARVLAEQQSKIARGSRA